MPVYLLHGFRWPREGFTGIRVHTIVHNLEDMSTEYIQNENSRTELLASFHKLYPDIMKELDGKLEFIEQYNPDDVDSPNAVCQPYAYIGDKVVTLAANPNGVPLSFALPTDSANKNHQGQIQSPTERPKTGTMPPKAAASSAPDSTALSINVQEVIAAGPGLTNRAWEALADLRDHLAKGENIGWWVVYNGDPDREIDASDDEFDTDGDMDDEEDGEEDVETIVTSPTGNPDDQQTQNSLRHHKLQEEQSEEQRRLTLRQKALGPGSPEKVEPQRHQRYQQQAEQSRASNIPQKQQQQQQRGILSKVTSPTGLRPRTAPSNNSAPINTFTIQSTDSNVYDPTSPHFSQIPPSSIHHIRAQSQSQQAVQAKNPNLNPNSDLTALPVRNYIPPAPPELTTPQKGKGREKETVPASKIKETAKSQGLRKKFFGKRV